jgi:hypothetical protein
VYPGGGRFNPRRSESAGLDRKSPPEGTASNDGGEKSVSPGLMFFSSSPIYRLGRSNVSGQPEVPMASISSIASLAAISAAEVNALSVDVGFSTSVNGKTYNADVTYSNGQYVADDANLAGAQATGSNLQSAENNLISRIDALV